MMFSVDIIYGKPRTLIKYLCFSWRITAEVSDYSYKVISNAYLSPYSRLVFSPKLPLDRSSTRLFRFVCVCKGNTNFLFLPNSSAKKFVGNLIDLRLVGSKTKHLHRQKNFSSLEV